MPIRRSKKEISVLMLMLAAETVCATTQPAASFVPSVVSTDSVSSTTKFNSNKVLSSSVCGGDSDSASISSTPRDQATPEVYGPSRGVLSGTAANTANVVEAVLSFLPWRKVIELRRVNRQWFQESLGSVAILRMPATLHPAIFIPCDVDLDADDMIAEERWNWNQNVFSQDESATAMPAAGDDAASPDQPSLCRAFLGQLRRDGTIPMVEWLLSTVLSEDTLLSSVKRIENHRHRVTHRGKGCAWVYAHPSAVAQLLKYNRRIFFDQVAGVEGCWLVPEEHVGILAREVVVTGYANNRGRHMPRNAVVFETPAAPPSARHPQQAASRPRFHQQSANTDKYFADAPATAQQYTTTHQVAPAYTTAPYHSQRVDYYQQVSHVGYTYPPQYQGYQFQMQQQETVAPPTYFSTVLRQMNRQEAAGAVAAEGASEFRHNPYASSWYRME